LLLNKEVKVILDLVRMKVSAARSKIVSIVITSLISGLLVSIPASIPAQANTPACVPVLTTASNGDTILTFTTVGSCNWTVPAGITTADVLVVGGGGAGGTSSNGAAGGGGGGQVKAQANTTIAGVISIQIASGGVAQSAAGSTPGGNGGTTSFTPPSGNAISSSGGSGGASVAVSAVGSPATTGYNGGGGSVWAGITSTTNGSNGVGGGFKGGSAFPSSSDANLQAGGGGGGSGGNGANAISSNGGSGGVGVANSYGGTSTFYGGGGGGAKRSITGTAGSGGLGGGGAGGRNANGVDGTANTGGGGGGGGGDNKVGGTGGSGVVVVRYATANIQACNPASTTASNGDMIVTFTSVGACKWSVPTGFTKGWVVAVGGGGGSGQGVSNQWWGAGGGGGEVVSASTYLTPGDEVLVVVGNGGTTTNGGVSAFDLLTASGGQTPTNTTREGGVSGSGKTGGLDGLTGTASGGGAGAWQSASGMNGGNGLTSSITGTAVEYGGGGTGYNGTTAGTGRPGAGTLNSLPLANRGGGAAWMLGGRVAAGSGVVIVRYSTTPSDSFPSCASGVGVGGIAGTTANQAGHGCVLIKFSLSNQTYFETFNYTGSDQSWTSPRGVTSATFYLVGAGGGAMNVAGRGAGASGGFATGTYALSTPTTFTIIVGQGGNGTTQGLDTYGGGGKADYGSGGGRSAIRLANATEDFITAGGAGGGGYDAKCGGAGGGSTGQNAEIRTVNEHGKGGTQEAGGAGGLSVNSGRAGVAGAKYQGGLGRDESGGGGGGFYGGGGGGDNTGGGGGSGYLHPTLISSGALVQGTCGTPGNSSALQFTISYDANSSTSGTKPSNATINAFSSTTLATNSGTLARNGFSFGGWNTRADGTGTTYTAGQTNFSPTRDITLFAQWNSTITFNGNGHTSASGTVPAPITTGSTQANVALPAFGSLAKTRYTFAGWNTQADGLGTNYASGFATYQPIGSTTLHAKWVATVTYDPNGATGAPSKTSDVLVNNESTIAASSLATIGTMVRTGYRFTGWNTAANGTGTNYINANDVTVPSSYMQFKPSGYNSSTKKWAEANGKTSLEATVVCSNNTNCVTTQTVGVDGTNTNGSNKVISTIKGTTASKVTFKNVELSSYTFCHVTRYAGSAKERIFTHPTVNWVSGFLSTFTGYYYGNGNAGSVAQGNGDTNWHLICDYNLNFRNNGASGVAAGRTSIPAEIGIATWSSQQSDWEIAELILFDSILTLPQIEKLEDELRTTYGLTGYTTPTSPASGLAYTLTTTPTLFAQWAANSYSVTFDANGGSGTMSNLGIVAGTAKNLTANTFTRTGYTFQGWTTNANGTGTTYTNSQSVTLFSNVTLYAKWLAGTFTITFGNTPGTTGCIDSRCNLAGQVGQSMKSQTFTAGTAFNLNTNVWYRTGFIFAGWSTVSGNGSPIVYADNALVTLFGNTTLYTQWTPVFVVSYSANATASTFTGTVPASASSVGGAAVTVAANSGNLARVGLTFAGWNTKADGTGTTVLAGSSFSPTANTTLHAMYLATCTPTRTTSGGFVVLTFTGVGNCLWTTPAGVTSIDLLTVGGGGGGAGNLGGGGGGGQVVYQTGLVPIGTAVVTVGAGGVGGVGNYDVSTNHGKTGVRSGFVSSTLNQVALGGSGGKGRLNATNLNADGTPISSGWTGGGAAWQDTSAQIEPDPGAGGSAFLGGRGSTNGGGGGGGAGGVGIGAGASSNAGAGGPGVSNSISGTATNYGGGGGTALYGTNANWTGVGGLGGGANATRTGVGSPGIANTGGGGSSGYTNSGGAGGTGIVILRYAFGTPSAPTITSISGSANKLTVAFTAPASDGGSAITNYEYSLDGGSTWTAISPTDATSPIEITKLANGATLTNGTTYQVAIRANNGKAGLGSNVVAGTTPLSPPTLSAVAGNARATISVAPAAGESPTSFTVTALDNSGVALNPGKTCTVTSPATSCVITGLTNGTPYKFSAIANLGSQSSTATTTSTGVTPAAPIVTYNANNGTFAPSNTATLDIAFNAGTPVVHPLPVRAGYNFTGWFNSSNALIGQNGSNYEPAATITLTAGWAGVTYSISYNGNGNTGGSVPATGSYINGSGTAYSIVGNTGALVKTGYTFVEWVDGSGATKSGNYSTGADLQLFAKWNPVQFTVSYDTASGGTAPANQSYTYGTTGLTLDTGGSLSKSGYTFLGWSKSSTGTTVSSPFIPTENTTLYARWSGVTYSVAFNSNGGSLSPATASFTTGGGGVTLPSAGTQAGYEFAGWSDTLNGNLVSDPYVATTNLTLYAKWTATQYTITYNRGVIGSTTLTSGQPSVFPSNATSTISTVITLDSTIDSSTVLSGTTYVFTGWKESGTNSAYKGGDSYRMPAANVTFTAQWVAVYTVSYILNGGSGAVPADVTQTDGSSSTLTAIVPTRAGFTFAGWKDQAEATVSGSTFTVGPTRYLLYAQWTPDVYTITYVPGANVTGTVTATTGGYKESVTLGSDSTLSYTNFKFVGWKIGTTIYSASGNYVLTGNVNAEAQWESTLSQIFYDINGGTGTAAPTVATQGQPVTLLSTGTFNRTGYALAGWIGGGQTTPVTTFTNSTTNSVTLIAKWTLLAPGIPAAPTAVAGSGSATVTVNPSTSGGPADSFLITASNGSTCRVDAPSTSCVITGLTDGLSYTFTSTATNSAGSATASVASNSVTPAGKPSIVTGVSATAGNGNAAVRFTAPATTGGAPIASYTVTASTGQTCIITPTFPDPLGCTVSGLTNGTPVTFAVQANNGAYTSDSSTATIAVTPATISVAPTAVTATSTTPGKATVTFTAPTDNGGSAIIEYIVTSSPGGLTCVTTNPTNGCEISGLTNGVPYTFTVVAKNGVDNSLPSLASTSITPVGKPSTPTNVVASPSNASATITFTAPNTGGSPITRYDVEAFDENGVAISPALTCTLNLPFPTPLACKFDGTLTNGLSYTFKVSATNVIGTSDTSTATAAITPANLIRPTADQVLTPTGDSMVGEVLTSSVQFGGFPIPSVTYVWERCTTSAATSCTTISGATLDTYTTTPADVGFYIRYKATGTNTSGTAVGTSATTDKITDNPVLSAPTSGLSGTTGTAFSLSPTVSGGADPFTFSISSGTLPAGLTLDSTTGTISGTPTTAGSAAITLLVTDAKSKTASTTFTISITAATSNVVPEPDPEPTCNVFCQAALAKAAADKVAADAAAKAAADKATADAAAKAKADTDATSASTKAAADAIAAAAAAKAAVDKAAAAAVAQAAADTAAKNAAAAAKIAADAQAAANKAAADAAAALKSSTTTAAAKAAATKSANNAAAAATAAVKAAATAAQKATAAKTAASNANKQVDIAINSLTSKTASAQSIAQANAIAAAAKAAANAAAQAAANAATAAKSNATAAQKAASDAAARIATEQKQAADAAAVAKSAADAAVKATADKIAADAVVTKAAQELATVLADKAALAEQAAKAIDETVRAEIQKKIEEVTKKVEEAQRASDAATTNADAASRVQATANETAETASKQAQIQAAEAVAVRTESIAKTAAATKAVTAATVATKVAAAAIAAAAKIPSKAVIATKPSTSKNKNSATATVTGLKPGQKVKVTVNVRPKP
jgi:uncharacterized repeat protein (TIGR02543 family)